MPKTSKNFATSGTESFELEKENAPKSVILNIEEPTNSGIILDKKKSKSLEKTGNFFIDLWNDINRYLVEHSKVKIEDKATFFHLLSVMINAGISMVKALRALQVQMDKSPKMQGVVEFMSTDIEDGASFSDALLVYPDVFTESEIGMVKSGEASGQLSNVLNNLAKDTEKAYAIRSKVKGAMTYPIIVMLLLVAVVVVMMTMVVPKLTSLFEASGSELPLITRIVVNISDFMVDQKLIMIMSIFVIILIFMSFKRTDFGKYSIDKFKINVPIFGALFRKAILSRFTRSLSNLLDSKITIVTAMEIVGNSIGNAVYREKLLLAMEDIKQGIPLAENLSASDLFPPMLVSMIDVGEKTAQMDSICAKIADFYEEEVNTSVATISRVIEPVVLIVIGLTVGIIVAAVMLPIMKLSNLTGVL